MFLVTTMMMRWIAQVEAVSDRITLSFTNDENKVEYDASRKAVSASEFITKCRNFNEDSSIVTMHCSSQTFSMIDKLLNENTTVKWDELAKEFTSNMFFEIFELIEYLDYPDDVRKEIRAIMFECILPRVLLTITSDGESIHCGGNSIPKVYMVEKILTLYLRKYGIGIRKEGDTIIVYRGLESEYVNEVINNLEIKELRILPEALNTDVDEVVKTDARKRLGIMLWLFNELWKFSMLDLSGCILTDVQMIQLSRIEHLKVLTLRGCEVKLNDQSSSEIILGFKSLEELDISEMNLNATFASHLCGITGLKKLTMEKCLINPESSLEFIRKQKGLEELRIGKNYLSEEHLNVIFGHVTIKVLNMDTCTVDDMYIYGGKIESLEILKVLNGRHMYIEKGEIRITVSEIDDLNKWKAYEIRSMFFSDDEEMNICLLEEGEISEAVSNALESRIKTWRLNRLNGSQVTIKDNKEIIIDLPQTCDILKELSEFNGGIVYFTGKESGKMNFLDVMKDKGFMKRVEEYNCGQVYFADKQMDMILSHRGLKKLNMRQCGLESKAIMKIKEKNTLMELDLSNNNMIGEDDMIHIIKECPNLRKLNMNRCRMLVVGDFKKAQVLKNLEELNIEGNKLNHECIKHITKHKKLLKLNLGGCGLIKDNLKGISRLKTLKELYVGDNFIGRKDLNRIFKLNKLEVLNMSKSKLSDEKYKRNINIEGIKKLTKLKILDMTNNWLCESDIDEVFKLSELIDLRMGKYGPVCGRLKNIGNLNNLEKLSIGGNIIDENDMKGVTSLRNLKELNMSGSKIYGKQVFDTIGKLNESLVLLDMERCLISEKECMVKLSELTNLRELRFINDVPFDILRDILERVKYLKGLYLGTVNADEVINCERFPLVTLHKLEILNLSCTHVSDEFVKRLSNLVNLRELTLICLRNYDAHKSFDLDISVFPNGLQKLKVFGECYFPIALHCSRKQDVTKIFENLEELCFVHMGDVSEGIISEIKNCIKLRKFQLLTHYHLNSFNCDLKGIERIVTLEELMLTVDLRSEEILGLACLKQLRRLYLVWCDLNNKYVNEIEELKSLEVLDIHGNITISQSMNGILRLKNLRKFIAGGIRIVYDKKGDFELIRGFEKLVYSEWEVYKNNECIRYNDAGFDDIIVEMRKEATLNNWKGVEVLNNRRIIMNSAIFLAISSKLVFIKRISLYLDDELRTNIEDMEMLKNCQMLKEVTLMNGTTEGAFLSSTVINMINDKSLLQIIIVPINELNIDFANLLLKCENLYEVKICFKKNTEGFFATLLKKSKESALRDVEVYYVDNEKMRNIEKEINFSTSDDRAWKEGIRKYLSKEDANAFIEARGEDVRVKVCLCTDTSLE